MERLIKACFTHVTPVTWWVNQGRYDLKVVEPGSPDASPGVPAMTGIASQMFTTVVVPPPPVAGNEAAAATSTGPGTGNSSPPTPILPVTPQQQPAAGTGAPFLQTVVRLTSSILLDCSTGALPLETNPIIDTTGALGRPRCTWYDGHYDNVVSNPPTSFSYYTATGANPSISVRKLAPFYYMIPSGARPSLHKGTEMLTREILKTTKGRNSPTTTLFRRRRRPRPPFRTLSQSLLRLPASMAPGTGGDSGAGDHCRWAWAWGEGVGRRRVLGGRHRRGRRRRRLRGPKRGNGREGIERGLCIQAIIVSCEH